MAIKEQRTFKASDGKEFDSKTEAQKHDDLAVAREEYKNALRKLNTLIAETTRTADGHLFDLGMWSTYYYITPGYFDMPQLKEVPYLSWNWDLNEYDDAVEIITREGNDQRRFEYKINALYREKRKALAALVETQKAWLAERREQIRATADKVARGEDPTRS